MGIFRKCRKRLVSYGQTSPPGRKSANGSLCYQIALQTQPLGLSSVKIEAIRTDPRSGTVISVWGADLMDGTPIYDIKPYIPADCHPDAVCGFADHTQGHRLSVTIAPQLPCQNPQTLQDGLYSILAQDPRPSYQEDPMRIYGFGFADFEVRFRVAGKDLEVVEII